MEVVSHIGLALGNVRPATKCNFGLSVIFKFILDRFGSFLDIAIFIFRCYGLKLPIHAHFRGFWGHISPKWCHPSS